MFPACAGMNRIYEIVKKLTRNVPRVRGDEPDQLLLVKLRF